MKNDVICLSCGKKHPTMFKAIGNDGYICPECLSLNIQRDEWGICAECGRVMPLGNVWAGYGSLWIRDLSPFPKDCDCVPLCPECLENGLADGKYKPCENSICGHGLYEKMTSKERHRNVEY